MNWEKTISIIPNGVQTESKRPCRHVDGIYPKYIDRGNGAYIYSGDNEYIDFPCGLGAILLGHNNPHIKEAVVSQIDKGLLFPLPNYLETEVAEKIRNHIPSMEMMRFLKTGSEATSAAVKIARSYTGKRKVICCGYHGWHDWYNVTTPLNKGSIATNVTQLKYNDIDSFEKQILTGKIAAVIIEPYVLHEPEDNFLYKLRKLCTTNGVVLIFDEVITGFRTLGYSAQKYFDIEPDLTCLGKALGNGFPIACVGGKRDLMMELDNGCFVSSTFGGELVSLAAANAVIDFIDEYGVIQHIWEMGDKLKNHFNQIAQSNGLSDKVSCIGYPPRTFFLFGNDEKSEIRKSLFWQECLDKGVFFGYAQFIMYEHNVLEIDKACDVIFHSMSMIRKYWNNPEKALKGKPAEQTLRLVNEKK